MSFTIIVHTYITNMMTSQSKKKKEPKTRVVSHLIFMFWLSLYGINTGLLEVRIPVATDQEITQVLLFFFSRKKLFLAV